MIKIDFQLKLNKIERLISNSLKPTLTCWLPVLSVIAKNKKKCLVERVHKTNPQS